MRSIRKTIGGCLAVALVGLLMTELTSVRALAQAPAATDPSVNDKLDALLKQTGMLYQKIENPGQPVQFKVVLEDGDDQTSIIIMQTATTSWKYPDGSVGEIISAFVKASGAPTGKPVSATVARRVAELSDGLAVGNFSINPSGLFSNLGFFLRGVEPSTLQMYLYKVHFNAIGLRQAVAPILATEASEK